MRAVLAAILLCLAPVSATARPSPYPPPDEFTGDRYTARQAQMGPEVARAVKAKQGAKARRAAPTRRHAPPRQRWRQVPIFAPYVAVGRPRAWCGWWLGQHLGMPLRHLWLARNWATVGSSASPAPGVIVVWRHHVGIITGRTAAGWIVKSGNDGGRVRERPRSITGAIAFRTPHGGNS